MAAQPAVGALLSTLDRLKSIGDSGSTGDDFRQKDRTWALFTHNVIDVTDKLSLTLGARYTHDRKSFNATVASDTNVCAQQAAVIQPLLAQIAAGAGAGVISPTTARDAQAARIEHPGAFVRQRHWRRGRRHLS